MEDEDYEQLARFTTNLLAAYETLANLLQRLPIPIEVPRLEEKKQLVALQQGVAKAHDALVEMPGLGEEAKYLLQEVLLEWLVACNLGFSIYNNAEQGKREGWRLEAMDRSLDRLQRAFTGRKGIL